MDDLSAQEKGLALEQKLYDLFSKQGYQVTHNIKRTGRSGTDHQIDVLAEYQCPLHKSMVIVEAKSYSTPIDKDRIMKLIQIVDDLGADKGVIATTSYFTPSAISIAKGHNIDLWDESRLVELIGRAEIEATKSGSTERITPSTTDRYLTPTITLENAKTLMNDLLQKRAKGSFLGVGKVNEELLQMSMFYTPIYEFEVQSKVKETQRTGILSSKQIEKMCTTRLWIDGLSGDLLVYGDTGISYPYKWIWKLKAEETAVIKFVGQRTFAVKDLAALGHSEGKARQLVSSLVAKGVVTSIHGKPVTYKSKVEFPYDIRPLMPRNISNPERKSDTINEKVFNPTVDLSATIAIVKFIWNVIDMKSTCKIFYPFYSCVLKSEDGTKRLDVLDGVSGELNEQVAKRMTIKE